MRTMTPSQRRFETESIIGGSEGNLNLFYVTPLVKRFQLSTDRGPYSLLRKDSGNSIIGHKAVVFDSVCR